MTATRLPILDAVGDGEGSLQVHLDENAQPQSMSDDLELFHGRKIERGGDQQDSVGAHRTGLVDLIWIDQKVFAQHG